MEAASSLRKARLEALRIRKQLRSSSSSAASSNPNGRDLLDHQHQGGAANGAPPPPSAHPSLASLVKSLQSVPTSRLVHELRLGTASLASEHDDGDGDDDEAKRRAPTAERAPPHRANGGAGAGAGFLITRDREIADTVEREVEGVQEAVLQQESQRRHDELDLTNLRPRKPNWDLRRDVERRLARLAPRDREARLLLIRKRLADQQQTQRRGQGGREGSESGGRRAAGGGAGAGVGGGEGGAALGAALASLGDREALLAGEAEARANDDDEDDDEEEGGGDVGSGVG